MVTQYVQAYVKRSGIQTKIEVMQGDNGRELKCQIMDMTIPEDCTARIYCRKPSGKEVYNDCTVVENAVVVKFTTQMIAEVGTTQSQVELNKNGEKVTTFTFLLSVKKSLVSENTIESKDEFTALEKALNDARASAYQAVSEYVDEHGVEVPGEKIESAVDNYFNRNPVENGKSAYEIWLAAGNEGAEEDFLAAIKGDQGEKGDPGEKGDSGVPGTPGSDASVTSENIKSALGFAPASEQTVSELSKEITDLKDNAVAVSYDPDTKTLNISSGSGGVTASAVAEIAAQYDVERIVLDGVELDISGNKALINNVAEVVKTEVPFIKTAEQPIFVNSIDEMTDSSKAYVMPDGYLYGYKQGENYNLFKPSEVSYQSRLQDDAEGIVTSNTSNLVTGWIPVEYGKYYALSALYPGEKEEYAGTRVLTLYPSVVPVASNFIRRVNAKKTDGTVIVGGTNYGGIASVASNGTIKIVAADVVAIQVQVYIARNSNEGVDINTSDKVVDQEVMFVGGSTKEDAYDIAVNSAYVSGDAEVYSEWYNTGHKYQPADYEDRILDLESGVSSVKEDVKTLRESVGNPASASLYYRKVNWGCVPTEYFRGRCDSYDNETFTNNTKYADYISKFKALIVGHETYVTETELGTASDGQPIYLYDFKPARWSNEMIDIPKIIIVAGHHGTEKCNVFGIYYLVKDLLNNWYGSPTLEYLRNHVELMIVPVVNTYGFDHFTYKNGNGVNINRNYSANWKLLDDASSEQYGGAEPFDQPESQTIREFILSNSDAALVIDSHSNSSSAAVSWDVLGYYGINKIDDDYFNRVRNALPELMAKISANFNVDYSLDAPDTCFGFLNVVGGNGIFRTWVCDNNIVGVLIEGFAGFVGKKAVTAEVFKANEEQMVNWLITVSYYLSR